MERIKITLSILSKEPTEERISGLGSAAPAGGATRVTDPDEVPVPSLRKQHLAGDISIIFM